MFNRQSIHIALLLWGFIFSLIAAFCTSFSYHYDRNKRKVMIHMQLASSFLMLLLGVQEEPVEHSIIL